MIAKINENGNYIVGDKLQIMDINGDAIDTLLGLGFLAFLFARSLFR